MDHGIAMNASVFCILGINISPACSGIFETQNAKLPIPISIPDLPFSVVLIPTMASELA